MGRLRKIEQIANKVVPIWSNVKLYPRGIPYYIDPILRGTQRFARKVGNDISLLSPENTVYLTKDVTPQHDEIYIDRILQWFDFGVILRIGTEFGKIYDFSQQQKEYKIILEEMLQLQHTAKDTVYIHAIPLLALGSISKGDMTIQVRSKLGLYRGDKISYLGFPGFLGSLVDIQVDSSEFLSTSPHPAGFDLNYEITLSKPITVNLGDGEILYVRAYPAYASKTIGVPYNFFSTTSIGPFLLDYMSGRLSDGKPIDEFLSVATYDKFGVEISPLSKYGKNTSISNVSVRADVLLFWDVAAGTFRYEPEKVQCVCNSDGKFTVVKEVTPNFTPGTEWNVFIESEAIADVFVYFHPNTLRTVNIPAGEGRYLKIGTTSSEQPVERIEFSIKSQPNSVVRIGSWQVVGKETQRLSYELVGQAVDEAVWQASGLIIKPYFFNLDYLSGRYDTGQRYNAGLVYL